MALHGSRRGGYSATLLLHHQKVSNGIIQAIINSQIFLLYRPMDLLKMEDKLDSGEYHKFSEFRNDFRLIVNNCRLYNGHNNGRYN